MRMTKFLQVKKPWRMLDRVEDFRTYTGRHTVEAYRAYYITKLLKQQYNVHNKYLKQVNSLFFKLFLKNNFRLNLQLQPYQLFMYPYFQSFKAVYLKDTVFFLNYLPKMLIKVLLLLKITLTLNF